MTPSVLVTDKSTASLTVRVSEAAEAVNVKAFCVPVRLPVVLTLAPIVVLVTSTLNPQERGTARPEAVMTFVPAVAVIVPPHVFPITLGGVATVMPAGKLSVKAVDVIGPSAELFIIENARVETPPVAIVSGENVLVNSGFA